MTTAVGPKEAPVVDTDRLVLRAHTLKDFDAFAAMWGDPEVTKYIGGKPSTREESWWRLLRLFGHWQLLGFGSWAIEERSSGRYVGDVGFADLRRDLQPSIEGVPELGWALSKWAHGKGYATEAARAAIAWGERRFGLGRTVCIISPDNLPSIHVAQKLGFKECGRTTYHGEATILFER